MCVGGGAGRAPLGWAKGIGQGGGLGEGGAGLLHRGALGVGVRGSGSFP